MKTKEVISERREDGWEFFEKEENYHPKESEEERLVKMERNEEMEREVRQELGRYAVVLMMR